MKKILFKISAAYSLALLLQSCGNGCIDSYDADSQNFQVHYSWENYQDYSPDDETIQKIDGLIYENSGWPVVVHIGEEYGSPSSSQYHNDFKVILRKEEGDLFTGCIIDNHFEDTEKIFKFSEGRLVSIQKFQEDPNGKSELVQEMLFENGMPNGKWFDKDWKQTEEGSGKVGWEPRVLGSGSYLNGKPHGEWTKENNSTKYLSFYDNGIRVGTWETQDAGENFKGKTKSTYFNDQLLMEQRIDENSGMTSLIIYGWSENNSSFDSEWKRSMGKRKKLFELKKAKDFNFGGLPLRWSGLKWVWQIENKQPEECIADFDIYGKIEDIEKFNEYIEIGKNSLIEYNKKTSN